MIYDILLTARVSAMTAPALPAAIIEQEPGRLTSDTGKMSAANEKSARPFIPAIIEKHLDEFGALWHIRQASLESPEWTPADLRDWDQRIVPHLDALLLHGAEILPQMEKTLSAGDADMAFASAYVLLRMNSADVAKRLMDAFKNAEGDQLEAVRCAMCHGTIELMRDDLIEAYETGPPPLAAAAAEVLAYHGKLDRSTPRLNELLRDEDASVRQQAWQVVAIVDQ